MMQIRKLKRTACKAIREQKLLFIFSFFLGASLAVLFHSYDLSQQHPIVDQVGSDVALRPYDFAYENWLAAQGLHSVSLDPDVTRYNTTHKDENTLNPTSEASFLYEKIHVTCLIFPTSEESALTVKETWGNHCNQVFFFSHKFQNSSIPVIKLDKVSNSFHLLCEAFRRIWQQVQQFQWLLVTTDDTFALLENLRHFIAPMNHSEPHYLGHAMQFWGTVYNWADAGYVISKATMDKLMSTFPNSEKCEKGGKYWKTGDRYLGEHLSKMNIRPVDTRDYMGRGRFNGYSFRKLLFPGAVSTFDRYWRDSLYLSQDGPHCCSNKAVTFHGVASLSKMYQLEYFFHHLRPFSRGGKHGNIPPKFHSPKETFLTEEEKLKMEGFAQFMNRFLTTPKNMAKLMKEAS